MKDVTERLQRVLHNGNLTVADLSRWFGRPYPTVRGWLNNGRIGYAALDAAYIHARLAQLETMLKQKKGLPVPSLSPQERIKWMEKLL